MKKQVLYTLVLLAAVVLNVRCSRLAELGQTIQGDSVLWITNISGTNYLLVTNAYQPLPQNLTVYVDRTPVAWMTDPRLNFWSRDLSHTGSVSVLSNVTNGGVPWLVYEIPGVDYYQAYELKLREGPAGAWENIHGGNGGRYKRTLKVPLLTENTFSFRAVTNVVNGMAVTSNYILSLRSTKDRVFVSPPANWYETYTYFFSDETNLFRSYPGNIWEDEWFGAEYKGGGHTFFKLYAPNIRRAWVAGEFNNWSLSPLYLDRGRVFWWSELSNTQPGQAYKFVIEQYANEWGGPYTNYISDPAAKKNEYSPAMNTEGNRSYIIDHSAYEWQHAWSRPGYDWYIIYQMHIRSWWTNGPGDYYGQGTFQTAASKFDYLQDLGFTAIEPLPIHEFAGDMSWGYNYVLFYAPESAYVGPVLNTVDTFKYFVDEAHGHGMAVVIDLVFNHMGSSDDVIASFDGAENWDWPDTYWYSGKTDWGPRFNFGNPVVRKFLTDSAKYLMKHYRVDGFRFDATYYIHYNDSGSQGGSYLYDMTRALRSFAATDGHGPNVFLVAENLPTHKWITANDGGNFDSQWNVNLSHHLRNLFKYGAGSISMNTVASLIYGDDVDNPGNNRSPSGTPALNYLVSHDEAGNGKQRFPAELYYRSWGNGEYDAIFQQLTGLATVIMARGVPMVFMGDEFIQGYYEGNNRYFIVEDANSWYLNWSNLDGSAANVHKAVRDLITIRKSNAGVRYSDLDTSHINDTDKVVAFSRGASDEIFVIINYNKTSYTSYGLQFPSDAVYTLQFASPSATYGWGFFDSNLKSSVSGFSGYHQIGIPEYGVLVYRKQ